MTKPHNWIFEDVHIYRCNRNSFTIYVGGDPAIEDYDGAGVEPGVEHRMADRFVINLETLSSISSTRPILVNMSSCGGLWEEGMQMFSAILACPNPVTVVATKWARSMTSIIPLAADRFLIRPPAQYMYHLGSTTFDGLNQEAETDDIQRRKTNEMMLRLYIARLKEQGPLTGWSEANIKKHLLKNMREHIDVWLTADEAVARGFADAIDFGAGYRAAEVNQERRSRMQEVLRRPVNISIRAS